MDIFHSVFGKSCACMRETKGEDFVGGGGFVEETRFKRLISTRPSKVRSRIETNVGFSWTERRSNWSSCSAYNHSAAVQQSYKVCRSRLVFFPMALTLNLSGKNQIEWPHSSGETDPELSLQECLES